MLLQMAFFPAYYSDGSMIKARVLLANALCDGPNCQIIEAIISEEGSSSSIHLDLKGLTVLTLMSLISESLQRMVHNWIYRPMC